MKAIGKTVLAASVLAASAVPAMAHPGHDGSMIAGLAHPFSGVDHLAAMVAVGLWAATRPARSAVIAPLAFMGALTAGAVAGLMTGALPMVEPMVAGSVLVLGALLVLATRLSSGLGLGLIVAAGAVHGLAHGAEAGGNLAAYFGGFLLSSALLHGAGYRIGRMIFSQSQGRLAAGLALGATGLALLAA
ncbi:HupE/UreJ family protein [Novosphingobium humi]|uniref:HupE/UreJ family protein n=1 Tax=Novosphingobium humi TaxID=2282397 RepID=A0ABY7U1T2_9SPHN|nr:HupE/UreJ family protein [Novosphingobium humi]WCT78535.1 HupE/UreJ family protein [Novosphingobium humi]